MTVSDTIKCLNINEYTHIICKRRLGIGIFDYVKGGYAKIFIDSKYGNYEIVQTIVVDSCIYFIVK